MSKKRRKGNRFYPGDINEREEELMHYAASFPNDEESSEKVDNEQVSMEVEKKNTISCEQTVIAQKMDVQENQQNATSEIVPVEKLSEKTESAVEVVPVLAQPEKEESEEPTAENADIQDDNMDEVTEDGELSEADEEDGIDGLFRAEGDPRKMSRLEKGILAGVIILLLIAFFVLICMNWGLSRGDGSDSMSETSAPSVSANQDGQNPSNGEDGNSQGQVPPGAQEPGNTSSKPNGGNSHGPQSQPSSATSTTTSSSRPDNTSSKPDETTSRPVNPEPSEPSGPSDDRMDDYQGSVDVLINTVGADDITITITVKGEKITIPMQTTIFNRKVTKTGLVSANLFGFQSGITLIVSFPEGKSLSSMQLQNAWMQVSGDSLYIVGENIGTDIKISLKINGMRMPKW